MAARRRAGSFSPNTSRRLRIIKVDMLLDIACLLFATECGLFEFCLNLLLRLKVSLRDGDFHLSGNTAHKQHQRRPQSGCHGHDREYMAAQNGLMHYERAPRFRRLRSDVAPPPLRCAVQGLRSATAALESKCSSVSGAKGLQESIGKSAGEWHFTLGER